MQVSLFTDIIRGFFAPLTGKVTEKQEEKNQLLHKELLGEERSLTMDWKTSEINNSVTAADVVSLESSLPLKNRPRIAEASGEIPKIGVKYQKGEKFLTEVNTLIALGADQATIRAKILDDVPRIIAGINARIEIMFQQALSTGAMVISKDDNHGTGVRVSFGVKDEHVVNAETPWTTPASATPISDIRKMMDKADAEDHSVDVLMMSQTAFDQIRASKEGKDLVKSFLGLTGTTSPNPSRSNMEEALKDEFGVSVRIMKSTFKVEAEDGTVKTYRPWSETAVVGVPEGKLGRVVYGQLASEVFPSLGVEYAKSGNYILLSKYSHTDPKEEFTCGEAIAIPVLDVAGQIYRVNTAGN